MNRPPSHTESVKNLPLKVPGPNYLIAKRLMDIVLSLFGILAALPIMLITALAIKLCDKGPIFYTQKRLTINGKVFTIIKFRSMRIDAESDGIARLARLHDDRITPVGKFIRTYRIDELPQLINVLAGDMSLVGPRPERPEIASQYEKELPEFALRLKVKAGLTGLAQVYGRYDTAPASKLEMDLMYINRMSLMEDIRLILLTPRIFLDKDSASGIHNDH